MQMDFFYLTTRKEEERLTCLAIVDCSSVGVHSCALPSKGAESGYAVEFILHALADFGYRDILLHTDGEPAIVSLVNKVKEKRAGRTVPEQGPRYSHQSQGHAEQGVKAVEGQTRTPLHAVAQKTGLEFCTKDAIVAWAVRHAGFLITNYRVLENGRSS